MHSSEVQFEFSRVEMKRWKCVTEIYGSNDWGEYVLNPKPRTQGQSQGITAPVFSVPFLFRLFFW